MTPSGITTLVSDGHPLNAALPIEVTLWGITTLANDLHPENADSPIVVTPSGITTLVSDEHPLNAELPMPTTFIPSMTPGIISFDSVPLYLTIVATRSPLIRSILYARPR